MRERHASLPNSQSTLSTCNANRFGTSRGSRIFANEIRRGATDDFLDAAKRCPSRQKIGERTTIRSQPLYALTISFLCEGEGYRPDPDPVQPNAYTSKGRICLRVSPLGGERKTPPDHWPNGGFLTKLLDCDLCASCL